MVWGLAGGASGPQARQRLRRGNLRAALLLRQQTARNLTIQTLTHHDP